MTSNKISKKFLFTLKLAVQILKSMVLFIAFLAILEVQFWKWS